MEPDDLLGTLFGVAVAGGVFGWAAIAGVRAQKRAAERRAALAAYAAQREWEYRPADPSLIDRFTGAPFGRGQGRAAINVFAGRHEGRPFVAFDYEFRTTTGAGKNRTTRHHRSSVVVLELGLPTPGLTVGPTSSFGWLVNAVSGRDVQVGHPLFDATFTVTSPSPEFATDVLHPDVVEVLLHHPDLGWRLEGSSMLVVREGQHSPQEIEAKLHFMDAVLDRIPEHVRARLLGEAPR